MLEDRIKQIVRQCLNEEKGIYYDAQLIHIIIVKLFMLIQWGEDTTSFRYGKYKYCVTTNPLCLGGVSYFGDSGAVGYCRYFMGRIEIGISPSVLRNFTETIRSCETFGEFRQTSDYEKLVDCVEYVLAHEITHAQETKKKIDSMDEEMPFMLTDENEEGKFNEDVASRLEASVVYWFSARERQARLSQSYAKVLRKMHNLSKHFGMEFVQGFDEEGIYEDLYKESMSQQLEKIKDMYQGAQPEQLQHLLSSTSAIFKPKTKDINKEYDRLNRVLENIILFNEKKLRKLSKWMTDEKVKLIQKYGKQY